MPKFRTTRGRLTSYAFACGYIEQKENENVRTELYKDGCYHVRQFDKSYNRRLWECFDGLQEARKFYNSL